MKKVIVIISCILYSLFVLSTAESKNKEVFDLCVAEVLPKKDLALNELLLQVGLYFKGTPYVANTLDTNAEELLVINLTELDCTTFVESCLALAQEIKYTDKPSYEGFKERLRQIRYRQGEIDGYDSRLHYITDWSVDNVDMMENITLQLGGEYNDKPISFMSEHAESYPMLKGNEVEIEKIRNIEVALNDKNAYIVLSKDKIQEILPDLQSGDIVVFATRTKGLDYSHIGLIFKDKDDVYLLHASSSGKKVQIDDNKLLDYCMASKSCTGITVLRVKDLKNER